MRTVRWILLAAVFVVCGSATVLARPVGAQGLHLANGVDAPLPFRTVLHDTMGPWLAPDARVLHSPAEWTAWNHDMVRDGKAVAEEPVPEGIDWVHEAVLVATLGEIPQTEVLTFEAAMRYDQTVVFSGRVDMTPIPAFSSPCHVVALDKRYAGHIRLDGSLGLPNVRVYGEPASPTTVPEVQQTTLVGAAPSVTWGTLKALYR